MAILPYLDDWLVISPTEEQVIRDTAMLLGHVDMRLGLTVNFTKSNLTPCQVVSYLGLVLDSVAMRACFSPKRVATILQLLQRFRRGRLLEYSLFLRLIGMLTSASMVVPLGHLKLRPLQIWANGLH